MNGLHAVAEIVQEERGVLPCADDIPDKGDSSHSWVQTANSSVTIAPVSSSVQWQSSDMSFGRVRS
jgi:hypothetical protein